MQVKTLLVLLLFYFSYFSDFCQTNYLNTYVRADLHKTCRTGRTLAVDEHLKLFFRSLKGRCRGMATNFVNKFDLESTPYSSHDIR